MTNVNAKYVICVCTLTYIYNYASLGKLLVFEFFFFFFATFQAEDPLPECIDDVLQRRLIRHIEEVFVVRVTGNVLDFIEEGLWIDSSAVVVAEDLWRK